MAALKLEGQSVITKSGSVVTVDSVTLGSSVTIPAAGITGTLGSGVTIGDTATFGDINMSSGKSIKNAAGTALLTEAGALDNVALGSSVTGLPSSLIVKITSYTLPEYNVSVGAAAQNKANFVQIGSESWDVVLAQANSKIFIQMYFVWGGIVGGHIYFDMKRGGTSGDFLAGNTFTKTGLVASMAGDAATKFTEMSLMYLDNPGTNAAGTTLEYVPYVGQDGAGTETIDINNRAENNYQDMTSQINFLEIAV